MKKVLGIEYPESPNHNIQASPVVADIYCTPPTDEMRETGNILDDGDNSA